MRPALILALALLGAALAEPAREVPVGLVLVAGGGSLVRAGAETAVAAKAADVLFAGDTLRAGSGPVTFLFCPGQSSQALSAGGEVTLQPKQLNVKAGALTDRRTVASCFLPQTVRVAAASQQHYGISMTRGTGSASPPVPADKLPAPVAAELAPFDKTLSADPRDMAAMVGRAAVFEKHGLPANALAEYRRIGAEWKDAVWVKRQIFELEEKLAAEGAQAAAKATEGGRIYAVVVGISKYQKLPQDLWLRYAHADASEFAAHLATPRGGGAAPANVLLLTDEKATTAAIRTGFEMFLKARAGKKDIVFVLIAGHGTVETAGTRGAYIITYDSDPQDLASTALPMADVQSLFQEQLAKVGRVVVFVDVCHSGVIGAIRSTAVNGAVERLAEADGEIFGFLASRPKELSYEGPQYGGGHGAFTYFLLKGLEGDADANGDGIVSINEIIDYVRAHVAEGTGDKQHPRDFGNADNSIPLSDKRKPGVVAARAVILDSGGDPAYLASAAPRLPAAPALIERFARALDGGRILPEQPGSAFAVLPQMKRELRDEEYLRHETLLRVALEEQGQQVLLRYLDGDIVPQTRPAFASAARFIEAARSLTPESLYLQARENFFRGRTLLFDRKYPEAAELLERAVEIDPAGAYAYNALGIAYLEQADFARAAPAFRDAIRRAAHWAYPLHNLALTFFETGDYDAAIRCYEKAIRLAPRAGYLHYNLGLIYQKLNRRRESEAAYRKAMALGPDSAEPYNALGSLNQAAGHVGEAEKFYRTALQKEPHGLAARHNLALLLWRTKERREEALKLWRANIERSPDYLPSRLGVAEALSDIREFKPAIQEYRAVLKLRPEYLAARIAMADLLIKSGDPESALAELSRVRNAQPDNGRVLESIGDAELAAGRSGEAMKAYGDALERAEDGATRKRLRRKLHPG